MSKSSFWRGSTPRVHHGFQQAWLGHGFSRRVIGHCRDLAVAAHAHDAAHPHFFFTGHSLGGWLWPGWGMAVLLGGQIVAAEWLGQRQYHSPLPTSFSYACIRCYMTHTTHCYCHAPSPLQVVL